ncbi:MAG TPA: hypothetical protein VN238_12440, partial [Solirubrobacteraceae bacterium]|nr:hypothetical protein [Solirubrobacteraceae bacterium]
KRLGLGRKPVVVASGIGRAGKAGQLRVTLKASARATAKLRRARKVKAQLTVAVPGLAPVTTNVTLTR